MNFVIRSTFFLIVFSFVSCDNFLNKYPDSDASTEINSKEKIAQLLTAAYPDISYFRFLELRTDNVNDRGNKLSASRLNEAMYYWYNYDEEELDSPKLYWMACYKGIAHANQALELLSKYSDKSDPQIQALYAEAFLIRAYLHFMVANIWAPPYPGEDEAKRMKGIPYVENVEKKALVDYKVENLYDTYKKIERDLRYGLAWVRDDYYKFPKYHFNKKAAYAFAVRFFTYTAQWQEVVDYATYVLGNDATKFISKYITYQNYTGDQMIKMYNMEDNPSNLLITNTESRWDEFCKTDRYGFGTVKKEEIFERKSGSIYRLEGYYNAIRTINSTSAYWPKFTRYQSSIGLLNKTRGQYNLNVLFTTEEVFLNRIEAFAMLNNYQLAKDNILMFTKAKHVDGISTLDTPVSNSDIENVKSVEKDKIQPFYRPVTSQQAGIIYFVTELSRQQFIHEGMRWFDLRRFNISVDRNAPGTVKKTRYVLQPEDKRKVLDFPFN